MTPTTDLVLLSVACAFFVAGVASTVIGITLMAQTWFSEVLDGAAVETR